MKKGLLASTALIGAVAFAGVASAAEAPTWKLSGTQKFQLVNVSQDVSATATATFATASGTTTVTFAQDHGWYVGVGESELALNVSGTADNGLGYGFKVEIQVNTDDGTTTDEARIELSGSWGKIQLGDEDGAEDVLNVGGESVMGATGGFDGDFGDSGYNNVSSAVSGPTLDADSSDNTKISYFSPNFSGLSVGVSLTPTANAGEVSAIDGTYENHIGLGAKYDGSFGNIGVKASFVYAMASSNVTFVEDASGWSVGGVVSFGPASIGVNYADNGETNGAGTESTYYDVGVGFESGPMYFSAGYFAATANAGGGAADQEFTNIAVTADYSVAPGLGVYAEVDMPSSDDGTNTNDGTVIIIGTSVSF